MIRSLAAELYRAQQKVHKLQDQLENAPLAKKEGLRRELRSAAADCQRSSGDLARASHKKDPGF